MKNKDWVLMLVLAASIVLHMGVIRKEFDPIKNTQTDPISLKQKEEETKDGVKGPPTPSFKYYKRSDFLVKNPMQTQVEEQAGMPAAADRVPEAGEPIPEDLEAYRPEVPAGPAQGAETGQEDWWSEAETAEEPAEKVDEWQDNW